MNYKNTLWISHSAISSFTRCPHLYYLEYEYRNPETGNRIQITNPYLALGIAIHETIESLLSVPIKEREKLSLQERFSSIFDNYRGLKGGFLSQKKEDDFYKRGVEMIERVERTRFLSKPSISKVVSFPNINLIGNDVKLVGSIDWIQLLPSGGAHIIDFKTGNSKESGSSLQLPIYTILAQNNVKEKIEKVSYWYLQHDDNPVEQEICDTDYYTEVIRSKAREIQGAIESNSFPCTYQGRCFSCRDYEKIFEGEAEKISGEGDRKDAFCVFKEEDIIDKVVQEDFLDEREKKIFEMRLKMKTEDINKELRLSEEKSQKIIAELKDKLSKNLRKKELKVIIKLLSKN